MSLLYKAVDIQVAAEVEIISEQNRTVLYMYVRPEQQLNSHCKIACAGCTDCKACAGCTDCKALCMDCR